jgi:cysteine desulfurase
MIYLDYAATTPVDPEVRRAMEPYYAEQFGNPGSLHSFGQEAIGAVDRSREAIARAIGADFRQIVFTGSATEANNLALRGAAAAAKKKVENDVRPRIIISAIEHESVLETAHDLEAHGVEVISLPVNRNGIVDPEKVKKSLTPQTVLVSVMYANNEIGTIQPIAEIAGVIKAFRGGLQKNKIGNGQCPLFHTDVAQAFQFLDCNVAKLGVDLMTISSHKIYGPKGTGALYVKDIGRLAPVTTGGGQEFGLRSGTENVPSIVGFAKAAELASASRGRESVRLGALRDRLWEGIREIFPPAEINGSERPGENLPNFLNVYFPGREAQDLLVALDLKGLAVSSGSACRSRAAESSYVIEALGYPKDRTRSSIRFTLGRPTAEKDIQQAITIIKAVVV